MLCNEWKINCHRTLHHRFLPLLPRPSGSPGRQPDFPEGRTLLAGHRLIPKRSLFQVHFPCRISLSESGWDKRWPELPTDSPRLLRAESAILLMQHIDRRIVFSILSVAPVSGSFSSHSSWDICESESSILSTVVSFRLEPSDGLDG